MKKINLAVVDDQNLFRKGLIGLLDEFNDLSVMLEASNGMELLDKLKSDRPDVILLDIEMPIMDGIETTDHLLQKYPEIKILILTMHNDEEMIIHMVQKGAHGFLLKDNSIETVVDAIHALMESGYYFNDRVSKLLVNDLMQKKKIKPVFKKVSLSDREIEIIRLLCGEFSNREIAEKLCLSPRTVDGHRERILHKTKTKNVAGIVMYAINNNLLA